MTLFKTAVLKQNRSRPPVWFMRQAGRYHSHYQELKKKYTFIELCKIPEVACEATMGPIRDFDFDAAILFSDLLFPLEVMGMGLRYDVGPQLDWHLRSKEDLQRLSGGAHLVEKLAFQGKALELIRKELPQSKALLGFVGGPLTLFCYAVAGSHQGELRSARAGMQDGRFEGFVEKLFDLLVENMVLQAQSGATAVAILDTCAGEFDSKLYQEKIVPVLKAVMTQFQKRCPQTPLVYYSKGTGPAHWNSLKDLPISCLGIDWRHNIADVLQNWSSNWAIQGNVDPQWLFLPSDELEVKLREVFESVRQLDPKYRRGWICGLGHGVLPKTPESNVRLFLKLQKEYFSE